jgi:two-component system, sensor histidine kinase and response regulator
MVREPADAAALQATLAKAAAERDELRLALAAADAVIAELHQEAQAASRAKADFLARMTHEMRTPLSAVIGLAKLAILGETSPGTTDYLEKIKECAATLLEIVDDITDFSRLEKGLADLQPIPFSLGQVMANVRTRFAEAARQKCVALTIRLDAALPDRLVGDQVRLEQILGHLVGNAVKFTETGEVAASVDLIGRDAGTVRMEFSVRDTGIGMAPDTIPAMLESFTQADGTLSRPYGGTGLGLAIVRRGVALLGGELRIESQPGRGSLFSFCLDLEPAPPKRPAADASADTPAPPTIKSARPGSTRPLSGARILLVEDNAINQQVARENLQLFGATVAVARHGGEAGDMVQQASYDVVLMDVQMPVMDGLTATRRIRALPGFHELPIVALTAHALAEDRDRCLAAGMNDYLTKPIEPDRLLATLGQWIDPTAGDRGLIIKPDRLPVRPAKSLPGEDSGLNFAKALARLGGNERLLRGVTAEFVRDYADCAATLRRDVAGGELEAARRLAHTVKGVAGNIAADGLAEAARELGQALRNGIAPTEAAMDTFAEALDRTITAATRLTPFGEAGPSVSAVTARRFLLVDDAKLNRAIVSQILKSAGHEVVCAVNGKEACRRLFGEKADKRPFDCILMDIEMPEMDGVRAARLIRDLLAASVNPPCPPDIPIVALTFHDADQERERCRQAGMDDCLPKVYDREGLLGAIDRLLTGREAVHRPKAISRPRADRALPAIARGLAAHLREGSIRADEDLAALRELLVGTPEPPELAALGSAIERYDFSAALECLSRLTARWNLDPVPTATLPEPDRPAP